MTKHLRGFAALVISIFICKLGCSASVICHVLSEDSTCTHCSTAVLALQQKQSFIISWRIL